jgi:hypothetical protein
LLAKTDREKALAVVDEASTEARRIEASDADRPRGLLASAMMLFTLDRGRSWDEASDAIKAANSAADFTGEDGRIVLHLTTKDDGFDKEQFSLGL